MQSTSARPERYVLCLDDDRDFLKSLEVFLPDAINSAGDGDAGVYHFLFADDPAEALATLTDLAAEQSTVAMIITDQQMPSMKGTEFLMRARQITSDSVRILLTGHAGIEAAIGAINEHLLERYLTKPIEDQRGFALTVRHLLQRFEMSRVIERQAATLQGLYEFANRINGMTDLPAMREYVVAFTRGTLRCSFVDVSDSRTEGAGDAGPDSSGAVLASPEAAPIATRAPALGRIDDDTAISPELAALLRRANRATGTSAAFARMRVGESFPAAILALRDIREPFTDHDLQTLGYIADTASTAIEKQRTCVSLEEAYRVTKMQATHLEEANRKLVLLDRMKDDFLKFVSHELRTPLSHLSAISMLEEELNTQDQLELTSIVRQGYERLNRFVMLGLEYLDWSGRSRVHTQELTDLAATVTRTVESIQARTARHVVWELSLPAAPCLVRMPSSHVEDAVRVLLDNALKFSSAEPHVCVKVRAGGTYATLQVDDRGCGFPSELAARIFEPFTVLDRTHHEGMALNLARIRAMIEAFGGSVSAASPGAGAGASFTIEIPLSGVLDPTRAEPANLALLKR